MYISSLSEKFSSGMKNSKQSSLSFDYGTGGRFWLETVAQGRGKYQIGWLRILGLKFWLIISGLNVYMYDSE